MSPYRDRAFVNMFAGVVIAVQGWLKPSPYATHFSSLMFIGGGVVLFLSGVALFLAPESRSGRATAPPNER
jgi:predicted phage tail protein